MYKKIIVVLDGSAASECVFPHVLNVAEGGTEVVLVRVLAKPHYDYTLQNPELQACLDDELAGEAGASLKKAAETLRKPGVSVFTCVLAEKGSIAKVLQSFASKAQADLFVLSAHGKTGLLGRLMGSVADRLVHHSRIPVLLVHP